ncbi:putative integral membrane protein (TIGR00698 family) [Marinobacterium halophilum]|uniref:Putative integral membrane protein (TIGR00698 family) n=1 Tax=Marinobacterium halophilum TaxID=267374 RepID=A0A2P8EXD1_9GAMM|nr:putative sulfate exporter family transporter [Marinobacterium halophilum]PSL14131.1 putative integral membrane protein (TIGR00698 family) [Marinobacterium halophilum]
MTAIQRLNPTPLLPGLALTLGLSLAALLLAQLPVPGLGIIGPLTLAMLLGIIAGHFTTAPIEQHSETGLQFSRHYLLRAGIILYGLRISFTDLQSAGLNALLIDLVIVVGILATAAWVGIRWLKLDARTAVLIGAGSAICGAAAVLASAPTIRARQQAVPVAIATVVLFGSAAMLLYPWLFTQEWVQALFQQGDVAFGRLVGATTHEVAQVTAIAATLPADAAHTAVVTKLMRVMLLVPVLLVLSQLFGRDDTQDTGTRKLPIPWFALVFMLLPLVNSYQLLPEAVLAALHQLDQLFLAMAMAALGFATRLSAIRAAGWKPMALGALLFVLLLVGGTAMTLLLS